MERTHVRCYEVHREGNIQQPTFNTQHRTADWSRLICLHGFVFSDFEFWFSFGLRISEFYGTPTR